jgi:hypothetical protein
LRQYFPADLDLHDILLIQLLPFYPVVLQVHGHQMALTARWDLPDQLVPMIQPDPDLLSVLDFLSVQKYPLLQ